MANLKWKALSSEYLFRDLWFKVRKDICQTPSGKIIDPYYVYEFPEWVTAFALTDDNRVILVKQFRHPVSEICIELPGGCVDDADKDFQTAMARELLEETGYTFSSYESLGKISANPSTNTNWMHMFLATGGKKVGEQNLDHNEEIIVELITIDELKDLLRENKIVQAMHVTTILYALEKIGGLSY
ncbi:MAG TPA: NUDIX hydrolase [Chitinophagaceae bacterium]|nr:NUDIX hydrolase [Chitinophagaceae bacterium]